MDKSWMQKPTWSTEYREGVEKFLNSAFEKTSEDGRILCPCSTCANTVWGLREIVLEHLIREGFLPGYKNWFFHGEPIRPPNYRKSSSRAGVASIQQQKYTSMSAWKSFAKKAHEMEVHVGNKVSRDELNIATYSETDGHKIETDGYKMETKTQQLVEKILERLSQHKGSSSSNMREIQDQIFIEVEGERHERVQGLGRGMTPTTPETSQCYTSKRSSTQDVDELRGELQDMKKRMLQMEAEGQQQRARMQELMGIIRNNSQDLA